MSTRLVQMIIKKGLRAIGLDSHEYSAHSLRHTCAVMMLVKGATVNDIQRLLGHASPKTTMIYLKSFERRQRMEATPAQILEDAYKF
jgi:site-specific recombinase XerD